MTSTIETGADVESRLATTLALQQHMKFFKSYGAMTMVMRYLPQLEQLRLQGLDKQWWYDKGVQRVQVHFKKMPEIFYFADPRDPLILATRGIDERLRFDFRGESDFSNKGWISCQVGHSRLFQTSQRQGYFRILKIQISQRSFTVERQQTRPEVQNACSLTNFKDKFIFIFAPFRPCRYSLAEDRWEELPPHIYGPLSACSLGDTVYVFAHQFDINLIHVLHNPGASISSQELYWQNIVVPEDVVTLSIGGVGLVALNSTEIVFLGGKDGNDQLHGDIFTFNTTTHEFKMEMEDERNYFECATNQSAKVCDNTIIALVSHKRLIKYKKGDTCVTILKF